MHGWQTSCEPIDVGCRGFAWRRVSDSRKKTPKERRKDHQVHHKMMYVKSFCLVQPVMTGNRLVDDQEQSGDRWRDSGQHRETAMGK